jgi:hypothetical protein
MRPTFCSICSFMSRLVLAAALAVLAGCGSLQNSSSSSSPQAQNQYMQHPIVGNWLTEVDVPGFDRIFLMLQFRPDGTASKVDTTDFGAIHHLEKGHEVVERDSPSLGSWHVADNGRVIVSLWFFEHEAGDGVPLVNSIREMDWVWDVEGDSATGTVFTVTTPAQGHVDDIVKSLNESVHAGPGVGRFLEQPISEGFPFVGRKLIHD